MRPTDEELLNRHEHHPPTSPGVAMAHEDWRTACLTLSRIAKELVPASREQEKVFTRIEEAMFWGNAGIARIQ